MVHELDDDSEGPLSSEALMREDWRGGERLLKEEDAPGHTLPESESDSAAQASDGKDTSAFPSTILPPD